MKGKAIYTTVPAKIVEVRLNISLTGTKAAILFAPTVRAATLLPPISGHQYKIVPQHASVLIMPKID